MNERLAAAYKACYHICQKSGSNFTFAFRLLPQQKRQAMYALYAFHRTADDLGDGEEPAAERLSRLDRLRAELDAALAGKATEPYLLAVVDAMQCFNIPRPELTDMLDGVSDDVQGFTPATRIALQEYCRKVAGVVGQSCVRIWGFSHPHALVLAEQVGLAFQVTNILRDLRQDALMGRCYIPTKVLNAYGLTPDAWPFNAEEKTAVLVIRELIDWAKEAYSAASDLEFLLAKECRPIYRTMVRTYHSIFTTIERNPRCVLHKRRVRVPSWQKVGLAGLGWVSLRPQRFGLA